MTSNNGMSAKEVVELVTNLGFPIVAFLLMFWWNYQVTEKLRTTIENLKEVLSKGLIKLDEKEND